jgi:hypothetical protein
MSTQRADYLVHFSNVLIWFLQIRNLLIKSEGRASSRSLCGRNEGRLQRSEN